MNKPIVMDAKRVAEINQHCCQQSIETVLEHFGISHKELSKTEPFSEVKNNPNTRKAYAKTVGEYFILRLINPWTLMG